MRYVGKASKEYETAVQAVQKVEDGAAVASCAEALADLIKKSFAKTYGLTEYRGDPCALRLVDKHKREGCDCYPPWSDHTSVWLKDGRPKYFVSQPYGLDGNQIKEIQAYCTRHGLKFFIDARSWHYLGRTLLVIFESQVRVD